MSTAQITSTSALRGGRFLVTGGAGMVGSEIVDQLVAAGALRVTVLDNLQRGRRSNIAAALDSGRVELVEGDILDRALVRELVDGQDTVFHQAAPPPDQCARDPRLAVDVLVNGTFNVIEAVDNVGRSASTAARGGLAPRIVAASGPDASGSIHDAAKGFNEGLLANFRTMYGLDYVVLRYFNVYGPRMDMHGKYTEDLVRWMERIDAGLPPLVFGDGQQTMDLVAAEDIARANLLAAASPLSGGVYDVANGTETSLKELAETLLRVMGTDLPVEYGTEWGVNPAVRRLADTSAAARDLGFRATVGLHEGLGQLVEWWRTLREQGTHSRTFIAAPTT